jgi:hypothetical protein
MHEIKDSNENNRAHLVTPRERNIDDRWQYMTCMNGPPL